MKMKTSDMTTIERVQGKIEKRRYVMDFGPNGALKDVALKVIEDWITNGCRYTGAILIKPSKDPAGRLYIRRRMDNPRTQDQVPEHGGVKDIQGCRSQAGRRRFGSF